MSEPMITPGVPDTLELRLELIQACQYLSELGFCIGTWGNLSIRVEQGILITPSRIDYSTMTPDDLVVVSWENEQIKGHRVPSSELLLHQAILRTRPDFGALVHTHSPYASTLACAHKPLPVCVEDMAQIIGGTVNCAPYVPNGRHADLAQAAASAIGSQTWAVLLANHGPLVGGRSLAEAVVAARVLEKAAQIYIQSQSIGGPQIIPDEHVIEERHRLLYKYGQEQLSQMK
jgi:L-fuculose-phosphate aldolase